MLAMRGYIGPGTGLSLELSGANSRPLTLLRLSNAHTEALTDNYLKAWVAGKQAPLPPGVVFTRSSTKPLESSLRSQRKRASHLRLQACARLPGTRRVGLNDY